MKIEVFRGHSFKENHALFAAIEDIISTFYESTTSILDREFDHCNCLYITRNDEDRVNAFAMFAYETLSVEGAENIPSFYSGLCASRSRIQIEP